MISKHTRSNLVEMMDDCKEEAREHLDKEDKSEQRSYFKEGLHNEVSLLGETQKTNIDQNVIENGSNQDTTMPQLIRDIMCHTEKVADTMEMKEGDINEKRS